MPNNYLVTRERQYCGTDSDVFEGIYLNRPMPLADLLEELADLGTTARVANETGGWEGRQNVTSADELDGSEMIESELAWCDERNGLYRDYLTIKDGEGKPLHPRELFALLVMGEVVLL